MKQQTAIKHKDGGITDSDSWAVLVNVSRGLCCQSGPHQDISDKDWSQEVMDRHRYKWDSKTLLSNSGGQKELQKRERTDTWLSFNRGVWTGSLTDYVGAVCLMSNTQDPAGHTQTRTYTEKHQLLKYRQTSVQQGNIQFSTLLVIALTYTYTPRRTCVTGDRANFTHPEPQVAKWIKHSFCFRSFPIAINFPLVALMLQCQPENKHGVRLVKTVQSPVAHSLLCCGVIRF